MPKVKKRKLLPIGYIGFTVKNNIQNDNHKTGVTLFKIVGYNAGGGDPYPYQVHFLDTKFKTLNDKGPFLSAKCISDIQVSDSVKVLYGN